MSLTKTARRMMSQHPSWLTTVLEDPSQPPRLYAWTAENLELQGHRHVTSDAEETRRIYVLGIGNLGRLFASSLVKARDPPPITLVVHKKELLSQWQGGRGIEIERLSGSRDCSKKFDVEWWHETAPKQGPIREVASGQTLHNLIVTTKASAALSSADRARRYLGSESTVLFAQNGMSKLWPPHGPVYASHRFNRESLPCFLSCVVTHGLYSLGPFSSVHASEAGIAIGPVVVNERSTVSSHYLMQQMAAAPRLNITRVSRVDLWIRQLEKLVVNSIINPLTAVLRERNGFLFVEPDPDVVRVIDQLAGEAGQILQALIKHESSDAILAGSEIDATPNDLGVIRQELIQRFSRPRLLDMLSRVGLAVKDNKSSMLQDVESGKPTEIGDFNGWLVDMASFLNKTAHVSKHRKLIELVEHSKKMASEELSNSLLG